MATLEDLLAETGKFSRFQVMILVFTLTPKILTGWSMLMMSFAGVMPDWWCVDGDVNPDNTTFQICNQNETAPCSRVYSYAIRTIINEWDLVCDKSWIKPAVTSIQMGGVLVGAFIGGQSADTIGRRYTLYVSVLLHGIANVVAAYSVTWQMFAFLVFVVGFMAGSILVVSFTYPMEFIGVKERSVVGSIPNWSVGIVLFALTAWRLENWSHIHLVCAALHVVFLVGFFFVPDSVRWLAVQNRIDEAEKVLNQMCSMNGVARPANCRAKLEALAVEEKKQRESSGTYTYVEIVRGWSMIRRTVMIDFVWCSMSVIYYGLSFGVDKLSGNLYLNIFLITVIEIPGVLCVMSLTNWLGRRRASAGMFGIGLLGAVGVVIAFYAFNQSKGIIIRVLAVVARLGVGVGWSAFELMSSESYPTVIRNLGYGAANTAARVGGIVSPFLFTSFELGIPFIIVTVLYVVCVTCSLLLDETNGTPLQDTLELRHQTQTENESKPRTHHTRGSTGQEDIESFYGENKTVGNKRESHCAIVCKEFEKIAFYAENNEKKGIDVIKMKKMEPENRTVKTEDSLSEINLVVNEKQTEGDSGQQCGCTRYCDKMKTHK